MVGLALLSWQGQSHWGSDRALWEQAVAMTPDRPRPHINLGRTYDLEDDYWRAGIAYKTALQEAYDPRRGLLWRKEVRATVEVNIAHLLLRQGYAASAMRELDTVIATYPQFPYAHYNRGATLKFLGACVEAMQEYAMALNYMKAQGRSLLPLPESCVPATN